jgi:hypothetical protein
MVSRTFRLSSGVISVWDDRKIGQRRGRGGALQKDYWFLRRPRQQFRCFHGLPLKMLKAGLDLRRRRERRAGHEIEHTDAPYALSYDVVPVLATREAANDVSVDWSWR